MTRHTISLRCALVALLLVASFPGLAQDCSSRNVNEQVLLQIIDIYKSKSNEEIGQKPLELYNYIYNLNASQRNNLHDSTIDAIGDMVFESNMTVRLYAAHTLGVIGRRATSQVRKIEEAIDSYQDPEPKNGHPLIIATDVKYELSRAIEEITRDGNN